MGPLPYGVDAERIHSIARTVKRVHERGVEVAVVVGGGNIYRGRVVIFAAGTGNPFFTTDTAAALRALEIHAEAILMAKNNVEGVYDMDPTLHPDDATFLPDITHGEAIERNLKVMDSTALSLCR